MDAVVKEEEVSDMINMIEPKKEVEDTVEWIEPKIELIDEKDVKAEEEIDDKEYQHIIPYEYRDYMERNDVELQLGTTDHKKLSSPEEKSVKCQKCRKLLAVGKIQAAQQHAVLHTNLYRFECREESCCIRSWRKHSVVSHVVGKHNGNMDYVKEKKITDKEQVKLTNMVGMCFPGLLPSSLPQNLVIDDIEVKVEKECRDYFDQHIEEEQPTNSRAASIEKPKVECQKCRRFIKMSGFQSAETHAASHTDIAKYFCSVKECGYKYWQLNSLKRHLRINHGIVDLTSKYVYRTLSEKDKKELRKIVDECFPGMKQDSSQTFSTKGASSKDTKSTTTELYCHLCQWKAVGNYEKLEKLWQDHAKTHEASFNTKKVQPSRPRKRPADAEPKIKCQKCSVQMTLKIDKLKNHASIHMGFEKCYPCPAPKCEFISYRYSTLGNHITSIHPGFAMSGKHRKLVEEEGRKMDDILEECFPEIKRFICQVCHQKVDCCGDAKIKHAVTHLDPQVYNCIEQDCNFSTDELTLFDTHLMTYHQKCLGLIRRNFEEEKRQSAVQISLRRCFPGSKEVSVEKRKQHDYTCQICQKEVTEESECSKNARRNHASEHVDIMLYKCSVPDCQFQTKYQSALSKHHIFVHGTPFKFSSSTKVTLTEQVVEIEKMLIQCFPETIKKDS